jgi:hypothetical protein
MHLFPGLVNAACIGVKVLIGYTKGCVGNLLLRERMKDI